MSAVCAAAGRLRVIRFRLVIGIGRVVRHQSTISSAGVAKEEARLLREVGRARDRQERGEKRPN